MSQVHRVGLLCGQASHPTSCPALGLWGLSWGAPLHPGMGPDAPLSSVSGPQATRG